MKKYIEPEVEVIEYLVHDVIAKSTVDEYEYGSDSSNTDEFPTGGGGEGGVPDIIGGGDGSSTGGDSGWTWD